MAVNYMYTFNSHRWQLLVIWQHFLQSCQSQLRSVYTVYTTDVTFNTVPGLVLVTDGSTKGERVLKYSIESSIELFFTTREYRVESSTRSGIEYSKLDSILGTYYLLSPARIDELDQLEPRPAGVGGNSTWSCRCRSELYNVHTGGSGNIIWNIWKN